MQPEDEPPIESLGLSGDGDEIAALRKVERRFGVKIDCSNACNWVSVGDVYAALRDAISPKQLETGQLFAEAISRETGVDPSRVAPGTLLLGKSRPSWIGVALALVVSALVALLTGVL